MKVGQIYREQVRIHDELTVYREWLVVSILSPTQCLVLCKDYWGKESFEVKQIERVMSYSKK